MFYFTYSVSAKLEAVSVVSLMVPTVLLGASVLMAFADVMVLMLSVNSSKWTCRGPFRLAPAPSGVAA